METIDIHTLRDHTAGGDRPILFKAFHANHFLTRLRGLLGRPELQDNEGLLLSPCAQVHTLGMRYPLDIIFIDKAGAVIKCVAALKPNRFTAATKAHYTLEVSPGSIERNGIKAGDQLGWEGLG